MFVIFGEDEYPALARPGDERSRSNTIVTQGSKAAMKCPGPRTRWRLTRAVLPLSVMTRLFMANSASSVIIYARAI